MDYYLSQSGEFGLKFWLLPATAMLRLMSEVQSFPKKTDPEGLLKEATCLGSSQSDYLVSVGLREAEKMYYWFVMGEFLPWLGFQEWVQNLI